MLSVDAVGLISAVFVAAAVEFVEAFTIVLAIGTTRGWRSALTGTAAAVLTLGVVTAVLGVALRNFVNPALLQLVVGTLLLVFGLQWVRKAVLRSAGLKALHDEAEIFAEELAEARDAPSQRRLGIDGFGFIVSFSRAAATGHHCPLAAAGHHRCHHHGRGAVDYRHRGPRRHAPHGRVDHGSNGPVFAVLNITPVH